MAKYVLIKLKFKNMKANKITTAITCLALSLFVSANILAQDVNIIENPSFETWIDTTGTPEAEHWKLIAQAEFGAEATCEETADAVEGSKAIAVNIVTGGDKPWRTVLKITTDHIEASRVKNRTISFHAKSSVPGTIINLLVLAFDADTNAIAAGGRMLKKIELTDTYTKYEYVYEPTDANVALNSLRFNLGNNEWSNDGSVVYIDDVVFMGEPGEPVEPPTSINNSKASVLSVYPNPANSTIQINGNYSKVNIYDLAGKEVKAYSANNSFDIAHLQNGVYMIKAVSLNGENFIGRFVKE